MRRNLKKTSIIYAFLFLAFSLIIASACAENQDSKTNSPIFLFLPALSLILICIIIAIVYVAKKTKAPKQYNINAELSVIDQMAGQSFEFWCAQLLKRLNYSKIQTTKATGDYGADIICTIFGDRTVVQCKRYNQHVGIRPIQEILGARVHYGAGSMLVITNNYFTKAAINLARESGVELWDRAELVNKMNVVNIMYAKEIRKKNKQDKNSSQKKQDKNSTSILPEANTQNSSDQSTVNAPCNPNSKFNKHDYEITIMRLYDNTTYTLYRLAANENDALSSIYRVIDINEKVIQIKDLGALSKKINP